MAHGAAWIAWCGLLGCAAPAARPDGAARVTVPTGAWQRDWIHRRGSAQDASVTVRYVQTPSVFGDVRIRGDRPALRAASFAELSDAELAALARQNGFAGTLTVDGANATWHHEIDFQPTYDAPDIGRVEPAGDAAMFEHALDGAYVERWSALARGTAFFAVRVVRDGRVTQLLAVAGGQFVYARARAVALPAGASITDLIARTHPSRETLIAYVDCEISHGATRGWQIEHSTLPWLEGTRLAFADQIALGPDGKPAARAAAGETWSFPVDTLAPDERRALFAATR